MKKKLNVMLITLVALSVIILVSGITFAVFIWRTLDEQNKVIAGTSSCFDISYVKGEDIGSNENLEKLTLGKTYKDGLSTTITIGVNPVCNIGGVATLYLNTETETSDYLIDNKLLNYEVIISNTSVSSGVVESKGSIPIYSDFEVDLVPLSITVYIWLNGEKVTNDNVDLVLNSVYKGNISAEVISDDRILNVTPLSDFNYYLGSEYETVDSINYYDIDTNAYYDISIEPITLQSNEVLLTKYIGESTDVYVPDTYVVDGVSYNVIALSYVYLYYYDEDTDFELDTDDGIFIYNKDIKNVLLGDNIKIIYYDGSDIIVDSANWMFNGCRSLENVPVIPNFVTSMEGTFQGCTSLVNAPVIPNSVTNMNYAFYSCTNLVNAPVIPSSVTYMWATFQDCTSLTGTVRINSSNVTDVTYIFYSTSKAITVEVPSASTTYTKLDALNTSNGMPSNVRLSIY